MRSTPLDLQLDLPLGAAAEGDQLALPLDVSPLPYTLRRRNHAAIRVRMEDGALSVDAPRGARLPAIEAAVRGRAAAARKPPAALPPLPREWRDGMSLPFLGGAIVVRLSGAAQTSLERGELMVALPPGAQPAQIRDSVSAWLQSRAREEIATRMAGQRNPPAWSLSFSRTTLHEIEVDGRLRLNWRLVLLSPPSIDHAIAQACARRADASPQADLLGD